MVIPFRPTRPIYRSGPIIAGVILLSAVGLRFFRLGAQSLWSDEGNSVALAQAGFAEIAARTALDIHPPLYYWLLKVWLALFGTSEFAARSLSAMLGVLLVAVVYRLGWCMFNRQTALAGAFLAAVNPFQIYYAQETRMYLLLALLGAVCVWLALENWTASGRRLALTGGGYALATALGLYTQYAFPVIPAAINLAAIIALWQNRRRLIGWLALQLAAVALYLPWLPIAWRQLTTWPTELLTPAPAGEIALTLLRYLSLGISAPAVDNIWLIGFGAALILGLAGLWQSAFGSQRPATGNGPVFLLLILWLVLPAGLTALLFRPAYLKFLLVAGPAFCLLLGNAIAGLRKATLSTRRSSPVTLYVLLLMLLAVPTALSLKALYHQPAFQRDNYRGIAAYVRAVSLPTDAVILHAPGQQEVFNYYYGPGPNRAAVYPLPASRPLNEAATIAALEKITTQSGQIYAVYWATQEADPGGLIESRLNTYAFKAADVWFGNVRLVSYAAPAPAMIFAPTDFRFGEAIRLSGLALPPQTVTPGRILPVGLRWQITQPLTEDYTVFVQLLNGANQLVGQRDAQPQPPTSRWQTDAPVSGQYGLVVEPGTPPGDYRLIAGLYNSATGQRLPPAGGGDFAELGLVRVAQNPAPLPPEAFDITHPTSQLPLLGYDLYKTGFASAPETPLRPGDPLHLNLYWQKPAQLPQTELVTLRLLDGAGGVAQAWETTPAGVDYPMATWQAGEIVRGQFDLFLGNASAGSYRLEIRLGDYPPAQTVRFSVE